MIFYWAETPDGWAIPGIHGPWAEDVNQSSQMLIQSAVMVAAVPVGQNRGKPLVLK
jgi:hypothetical protein